MLRRIPTISKEGATAYLDTIDAKLTLFESLKDSPALLELAIWKSNVTAQRDQSNAHLSETRTQRRIDSLATVMIIVPLVFSFLTGGGDE